jgi:hypothetical protein
MLNVNVSTPYKIFSGHGVFVIVLVIICGLCLHSFLFLLTRKSVEEEAAADKIFRVVTFSNLRVAIGTACSSLIDAQDYFTIASNFGDELRAFSATDLAYSESIKIMLKGIGNILAGIYHLLTFDESLMAQLIINKPKDWEELVKKATKEILSLTQTKKTLQELYGVIEQYAIKKGIEITKSNSKTRYLTYADAWVIRKLNLK